jgi:hypothetical protein
LGALSREIRKGECIASPSANHLDWTSWRFCVVSLAVRMSVVCK